MRIVSSSPGGPITVPKPPSKRPSRAVSGDGQKVKAASAQLFADVIYWANIVIAIEGGSIARLFDPLLRHHIREKVKSHGLDPDEMWRKHQTEKTRGNSE